MSRRTTLLSILGCLALAPIQPGFSGEEALTPEELAHFEKLFRTARHDDSVKTARLEHETALNKYHSVLREAMLKQDPSAEPLLRHLRFSLATFVDSVWKRRDREMLRTLHYPVDRLDEQDKERWSAALKKLRHQEFVKDFEKEIDDQHRKQEQMRLEHKRRSEAFQKQARQSLVEIDPELKPIFDKLDEFVANRRAERASKLQEFQEQRNAERQNASSGAGQQGNQEKPRLPIKGAEVKTNQPDR